MKKIGKEFKEFIMRGNVLDMAVGVIIATAFGAITTSLINNIIMPLIGAIFGNVDLAKLNIILRPEVTQVVDGETVVVAEAVVLGIGTFIAAIINFILIALVVFLIVKAFNKVRKPKEEAPAAPAGPTTEELLADIKKILEEKADK